MIIYYFLIYTKIIENMHILFNAHANFNRNHKLFLKKINIYIFILIMYAHKEINFFLFLFIK